MIFKVSNTCSSTLSNICASRLSDIGCRPLQMSTSSWLLCSQQVIWSKAAICMHQDRHCDLLAPASLATLASLACCAVVLQRNLLSWAKSSCSQKLSCCGSQQALPGGQHFTCKQVATYACLSHICSILKSINGLQDFLGFNPSRGALAAVHDSMHTQAEHQQQWALSRLQHAAMLTQRRCSTLPVYGRDLRKVSSQKITNTPFISASVTCSALPHSFHRMQATAAVSQSNPPLQTFTSCVLPSQHASHARHTQCGPHTLCCWYSCQHSGSLHAYSSLLAQSQMGASTCRLSAVRIPWHMSTSLPHNPTGIWTSAAQSQQQS